MEQHSPQASHLSSPDAPHERETDRTKNDDQTFHLQDKSLKKLPPLTIFATTYKNRLMAVFVEEVSE